MHSKPSLAASHAKRWLYCTASVYEEAKYPQKKSKYQIEGDVAHALLDLSLKQRKRPTEFIGETIAYGFRAETTEVTKDVAVHVLDAYNYVKAISQHDANSHLVTEYPVSLSFIAPGLRGVIDAGLYFPSVNTLHIMDLKYGKGVLEEAENNEQLMIYGEAMRKNFSVLYGPIDNIVLHIIQPRRDHYVQWGISSSDLSNWIDTFAVPTAEAIKAKKGLVYAPSEKACKFCRASGECKAQTEQVIDVIAEGFLPQNVDSLPGMEIKSPTRLTVEEVFTCLNSVAMIKVWCDAIKEKAREYLELGLADESSGWKLVRSKTNRVWADWEKADKFLGRLGLQVSERREKPKLKSPAQIEKMLDPKDKKALEKYILKPEGGFTVAPSSDKRQAESLSSGFEPVLF